MTVHIRQGVDDVLAPGTVAARTSSAVTYRLGGRSYSMRTASKCKVCQSSYRVEIEKALIRSYGYTAIHRSLPEQAQAALTIRNIQEHAHKHLPLGEGVRRAVVEARAHEIGLDVEGAETALIDHISFAKTGLQKVFEGIADGTLEPDVKDGIAFAQILAKIEDRAGEGLDLEAMYQAFLVYTEAINAVCDEGQVQNITTYILGNPMMRGLLKRSAVVIEADSVEDEGESDV